MNQLSEHQFHTVWTVAASQPGYDKKFFTKLLEKLKEKDLINDFVNVGVEPYKNNKKEDDYELNMNKRWKDNSDPDPDGPTIKHFQ